MIEEKTITGTCSHCGKTTHNILENPIVFFAIQLPKPEWHMEAREMLKEKKFCVDCITEVSDSFANERLNPVQTGKN